MTHIGSLTATSFASLKKKKQLEQDLELIAELWDLEGLLRHHSSDVKNRVGQFVSRCNQLQITQLFQDFSA